MITEQIDSFAAELASDFAGEVLAADALLIEIVQANRRANYAELTYFSKHLNWDETAVRREVRRMGNVLRDRAIAGSPADRQAAIAEAATAAKVLESEGPKVAEQIAKLEAKLRSLESDAKLSTRRVEDQATAVQRLRELTPKHIADGVRHRRNQLDHSLRREISDIAGRIHQLECVLDRERYPGDPRGTATYMAAIQRCRHEAVAVAVNNGFQKLVFSAQWPSIKVELEFERAELKAKLAPMQSRYETELAKIEAPLDYYSGPQTE